MSYPYKRELVSREIKRIYFKELTEASTIADIQKRALIFEEIFLLAQLGTKKQQYAVDMYIERLVKYINSTRAMRIGDLK